MSFLTKLHLDLVGIMVGRTTQKLLLRLSINFIL